MKIILTSLLALTLSITANANTEANLKKAYQLYKTGAYHDALDILIRTKGGQKTNATVAYWSGLCQNRLQEFRTATRNFRKAKSLGLNPQDIDYELGQALYATQKFDPAMEAFKRSITKKFKTGASSFYVAYIHYKRKQYDKALQYYNSIIKTADDVDQVKQAAMYQRGEIYLDRAEALSSENAKKTQLQKLALPAYEKTDSFDDNTLLAKQARDRIEYIKWRYFSGQTKPWLLRFTTKLKYDSNVVTQADNALVLLSNTDSLISESSLFGNYLLQFGQLRVTPSLSSTFTIHSRRTVPRVYQNDQFSVDPSIETEYEYQLLGKPSYALFNVELNYTLRDYTQTHQYLYYQKYLSLGLGNRWDLFRFGATTLEAKYKILQSQDSGYNATVPTVELTQLINLNRSSYLSAVLGADFQTAEDNTNDLYSYRMLVLYNAQSVFWGIDISPYINLTVYDTRNQSATRGTEVLLNPALTLNRSFFSWFTVGLEYAFSRKFSQDKENYAYSQHVAGLSLQFEL